MYDFGKMAHRNLPMVKEAPKKTGKSFGLLSRNSTTTQPVDKDKQPRERVADYVMEIRREREKLKNG
jgi:hypothetical protein